MASLSFQIHHVFTQELYDKFGNHLNDIFGNSSPLTSDAYANKMMLFTDPETASMVQTTLSANPDAFGDLPVGSTYHDGGHGIYNDVQMQRVQQILDSASLSDDTKRNMLAVSSKWFVTK